MLIEIKTVTRIEIVIEIDVNYFNSMQSQPNNPLHGVKLEQIINDLVNRYGWEYMGYNINIRCFTDNPSVKSSLKFLRRTPWARTKVENMYLEMLKKRGN